MGGPRAARMMTWSLDKKRICSTMHWTCLTMEMRPPSLPMRPLIEITQPSISNQWATGGPPLVLISHPNGMTSNEERFYIEDRSTCLSQNWAWMGAPICLHLWRKRSKGMAHYNKQANARTTKWKLWRSRLQKWILHLQLLCLFMFPNVFMGSTPMNKPMHAQQSGSCGVQDCKNRHYIYSFCVCPCSLTCVSNGFLSFAR